MVGELWVSLGRSEAFDAGGAERLLVAPTQLGFSLN